MPDYAELADKIIAGWDALPARLFARALNKGACIRMMRARSARQLNALLNGYADLLSITSTRAN
ncbi:hypothetical protein WDV93_14765 [Pantoea ananatis]